MPTEASAADGRRRMRWRGERDNRPPVPRRQHSEGLSALCTVAARSKSFKCTSPNQNNAVIESSRATLRRELLSSFPLRHPFPGSAGVSSRKSTTTGCASTAVSESTRRLSESYALSDILKLDKHVSRPKARERRLSDP